MKPSVSQHEALQKIQSVFAAVVPSTPFDYSFADQDYERKFRAEERIGKLATIFSALALFISCLGLFGLVSFMAEQRTKEIGIRKVLGASVAHIWRLLSVEFIVLVIISSGIAIPLSWFFMADWIEQYPYRATITPHVFILAGIGAVLITLITVSFQAVKTATTNPVKSLQSE